MFDAAVQSEKPFPSLPLCSTAAVAFLAGDGAEKQGMAAAGAGRLREHHQREERQLRDEPLHLHRVLRRRLLHLLPHGPIDAGRTTTGSTGAAEEDADNAAEKADEPRAAAWRHMWRMK
jgi:hypothetical protein